MTPARLDALKRLCEAATAGPWLAGRPRVNWRVRSATGVYIIEPGYGVNNQEPDAAFIAEARTALPELIEALKAERERWEVLRQPYEQHQQHARDCNFKRCGCEFCKPRHVHFTPSAPQTGGGS